MVDETDFAEGEQNSVGGADIASCLMDELETGRCHIECGVISNILKNSSTDSHCATTIFLSPMSTPLRLTSKYCTRIRRQQMQ
eukprot:201984-Hanusia_phi.AAC.2